MIRLDALRNGLRGWLRQHGYSLLYSIGNLVRHPLASLMTVLVLAMAVLLPLLLWTGLQQLQGLRGLQEVERISVFIEPAQAATAAQAESLAAEVRDWPEVATTQMISPQDGLQQLREQSGFGDTLTLLEDNPLPWVMSVTPVDDSPDRVGTVLDKLQQQPWAELVQADLGWLRRLQSMLDLAAATIQLLAILLAVAVLLVVSNTIRLDVQNRQDEIDVLALSGATPAFIRRPFLYTGFLYGVLGGTAALLLLALTLLLLRAPMAAMARAYAADLTLQLPQAASLSMVVVGSGVLGLAGAWLAVSRRLQRLQPD
jgi:cell division transport system permease protein